MSIATITFAAFRYTTPAAPPASTPDAPVAAPAPTAPADRPDEHCACPSKRNGLADAVKQAVGHQDDDAPDLRDAVMDFARALMQALRAEEGGDREGGHRRRHDDADDDGHRSHRTRHHHGHGHHRHHDGDGYRSMRNLGERIEALAQDLAKPAPTTPATPATPTNPTVSAASSAPTAPVAPRSQPAVVLPVPASAPAPEADAPATEPAGAPGLQATVFIAQFHVEPRRTPFDGWQDKLLDAFRDLRKASQAPAADDDVTLRNQLASFLYRLATGLDEVQAGSLAAPTAPGALLDLAA